MGVTLMRGVRAPEQRLVVKRSVHPVEPAVMQYDHGHHLCGQDCKIVDVRSTAITPVRTIVKVVKPTSANMRPMSQCF